METEPQSAYVPFSKFSNVYDAFMDYIDYPGWVRYICEILGLYGIEGKRLLDLACGTGTCAILFAQKNFDVIGIDLSQEMLDRARQKISTDLFGIKFFCQDVRDFRIEGKVDVATCLYDSLNYLLKKEDLAKTFACTYRALEKGGAFIFDMNTEYALKEVWGNGVMHRNEGGFPSMWKNEYDADKGVGTLYLKWRIKENGAYKEYCEIHRERSYTKAETEDLLRGAGFKDVAIYAHKSFDLPAEVTPRIMVVAIK